MSKKLAALLGEIRACRLCEAHLPLGPRPILSASVTARMVLIGQAPGAKVHRSGVPWADSSGDRLRNWLGVDSGTFYDESRIALVPTGFCYPGRGQQGDLPPRPECAAHWHGRLLPLFGNVRLTLLIGSYAQSFMLGSRCKPTLTETVASWREYGPRVSVLPHPSPRNAIWLRRNPWFEREVIPDLRARVQSALSGASGAALAERGSRGTKKRKVTSPAR